MHRATSRFWALYNSLSPEIREAADKQFALLKANPSHPSLQFKKVGKIWSARVTLGYRSLATEEGDGYVWFWIGDHDVYARLIAKLKKG